MPTDCPQRDERMGWTGDRATGCYGESYIFDNHDLYAKWLDDGEDCQLESGSISDVFPPYWRNYTNSMTWPGAFITVADMIYTRFGDDKPLRKHYPAMKKWLAFMKDKYMIDGIMYRDQYGDWCMPPESPELIHSRDRDRRTRKMVIATPYYCHLTKIMAKFAETLGFVDDAEYFNNEFEVTRDAYNSKYLDRHIWRYDNNTVTANILPLYFGMVPEGHENDVLENIVERTEDLHGSRFEWEITIPANTEAEVWIPTKNGYKVKTLGSGKYFFSSSIII